MPFKNRFSFIFRAIALVLSLTLLWQDFIFAQGGVAETVYPKKQPFLTPAVSFNPPSEIGEKTHERFFSDRRGLVIDIQDAHASLNAQKNIVKLLETISSRFDLGLIGLEGSSGKVDASLAAAYPSETVRAGVAETLLEETKISAGEFYRILSKNRVELFGVEDQSLYKSNVESFKDLLSYGSRLGRPLGDLQKSFGLLTRAVMPPDFILLHQALLSRETDSSHFDASWKVLKILLNKYSIALENYPGLLELDRMKEAEEKIDFKKAEENRFELMQLLKDRLAQEPLRRLVLASLEFKLGKKSAGDFHSLLLEAARGAGLGAAVGPDLTAYTDYIGRFEKIRLFSVFDEMDRLKNEAEGKILVTDEQREFRNRLEALRVLSKMVQGTMTSSEDEFYGLHRALFDMEELRAYLRTMGNKYKTEPFPDSGWEGLSPALFSADRFYSLVKKRNAVMLENLRKKMEAGGFRVAVLVNGGFHSGSLSGLMSENRVSHIVILPKFGQDPKDRPYLTVITAKNSFLDQDLKKSEQEEAAALTLAQAVKKGKPFKEARHLFASRFRRIEESEGYVFRGGFPRLSRVFHEKPAVSSGEPARILSDRMIAPQSIFNGGYSPDEIYALIRGARQINRFVIEVGLRRFEVSFRKEAGDGDEIPFIDKESPAGPSGDFRALPARADESGDSAKILQALQEAGIAALHELSGPREEPVTFEMFDSVFRRQADIYLRRKLGTDSRLSKASLEAEMNQAEQTAWSGQKAAAARLAAATLQNTAAISELVRVNQLRDELRRLGLSVIPGESASGMTARIRSARTAAVIPQERRPPDIRVTSPRILAAPPQVSLEPPAPSAPAVSKPAPAVSRPAPDGWQVFMKHLRTAPDLPSFISARAALNKAARRAHRADILQNAMEEIKGLEARLILRTLEYLLNAALSAQTLPRFLALSRRYSALSVKAEKAGVETEDFNRIHNSPQERLARRQKNLKTQLTRQAGNPELLIPDAPDPASLRGALNAALTAATFSRFIAAKARYERLAGLKKNRALLEEFERLHLPAKRLSRKKRQLNDQLKRKVLELAAFLKDVPDLRAFLFLETRWKKIYRDAGNDGRLTEEMRKINDGLPAAKAAFYRAELGLLLESAKSSVTVKSFEKRKQRFEKMAERAGKENFKFEDLTVTPADWELMRAESESLENFPAPPEAGREIPAPITESADSGAYDLGALLDEMELARSQSITAPQKAAPVLRSLDLSSDSGSLERKNPEVLIIHRRPVRFFRLFFGMMILASFFLGQSGLIPYIFSQKPVQDLSAYYQNLIEADKKSDEALNEKELELRNRIREAEQKAGQAISDDELLRQEKESSGIKIRSLMQDIAEEKQAVADAESRAEALAAEMKKLDNISIPAAELRVRNRQLEPDEHLPAGEEEKLRTFQKSLGQRTAADGSVRILRKEDFSQIAYKRDSDGFVWVDESGIEIPVRLFNPGLDEMAVVLAQMSREDERWRFILRSRNTALAFHRGVTGFGIARMAGGGDSFQIPETYLSHIRPLSQIGDEKLAAMKIRRNGHRYWVPSSSSTDRGSFLSEEDLAVPLADGTLAHIIMVGPEAYKSENSELDHWLKDRRYFELPLAQSSLERIRRQNRREESVLEDRIRKAEQKENAYHEAVADAGALRSRRENLTGVLESQNAALTESKDRLTFLQASLESQNQKMAELERKSLELHQIRELPSGLRHELSEFLQKKPALKRKEQHSRETKNASSGPGAMVVPVRKAERWAAGARMAADHGRLHDFMAEVTELIQETDSVIRRSESPSKSWRRSAGRKFTRLIAEGRRLARRDPENAPHYQFKIESLRQALKIMRQEVRTSANSVHAILFVRIFLVLFMMILSIASFFAVDFVYPGMNLRTSVESQTEIYRGTRQEKKVKQAAPQDQEAPRVLPFLSKKEIARKLAELIEKDGGLRRVLLPLEDRERTDKTAFEQAQSELFNKLTKTSRLQGSSMMDTLQRTRILLEKGALTRETYDVVKEAVEKEDERRTAFAQAQNLERITTEIELIRPSSKAEIQDEYKCEYIIYLANAHFGDSRLVNVLLELLEATEKDFPDKSDRETNSRYLKQREAIYNAFLIMERLNRIAADPANSSRPDVKGALDDHLSKLIRHQKHPAYRTSLIKFVNGHFGSGILEDQPPAAPNFQSYYEARGYSYEGPRINRQIYEHETLSGAAKRLQMEEMEKNDIVFSAEAPVLGLEQKKFEEIKKAVSSGSDDLERLLISPDEKVRANLAIQLGFSANPENMIHLVPLLRDADPTVVRCAAWATGLYRSLEHPDWPDPLVRALIEVLHNRSNAFERARGQALLSIASSWQNFPQAIYVIGLELNSKPSVSASTLDQVWKKPEERKAVTELTALCSEKPETYFVKMTAIKALLLLDSPEGMEALLQFIDDKDPLITQKWLWMSDFGPEYNTAWEALETLAGHYRGDKPGHDFVTKILLEKMTQAYQKNRSGVYLFLLDLYRQAASEQEWAPYASFRDPAKKELGFFASLNRQALMVFQMRLDRFGKETWGWWAAEFIFLLGFLVVLPFSFGWVKKTSTPLWSRRLRGHFRPSASAVRPEDLAQLPESVKQAVLKFRLSGEGESEGARMASSLDMLDRLIQTWTNQSNIGYVLDPQEIRTTILSIPRDIYLKKTDPLKIGEKESKAELEFTQRLVNQLIAVIEILQKEIPYERGKNIEQWDPVAREYGYLLEDTFKLLDYFTRYALILLRIQTIGKYVEYRYSFMKSRIFLWLYSITRLRQTADLKMTDHLRQLRRAGESYVSGSQPDPALAGRDVTRYIDRNADHFDPSILRWWYAGTFWRRVGTYATSFIFAVVYVMMDPTSMFQQLSTVTTLRTPGQIFWFAILVSLNAVFLLSGFLLAAFVFYILVNGILNEVRHQEVLAEKDLESYRKYLADLFGRDIYEGKSLTGEAILDRYRRDYRTAVQEKPIDILFVTVGSDVDRIEPLKARLRRNHAFDSTLILFLDNNAEAMGLTENPRGEVSPAGPRGELFSTLLGLKNFGSLQGLSAPDMKQSVIESLRQNRRIRELNPDIRLDVPDKSAGREWVVSVLHAGASSRDDILQPLPLVLGDLREVTTFDFAAVNLLRLALQTRQASALRASDPHDRRPPLFVFEASAADFIFADIAYSGRGSMYVAGWASLEDMLNPAHAMDPIFTTMGQIHKVLINFGDAGQMMDLLARRDDSTAAADFQTSLESTKSLSFPVNTGIQGGEFSADLANVYSRFAALLEKIGMRSESDGSAVLPAIIRASEGAHMKGLLRSLLETAILMRSQTPRENFRAFLVDLQKKLIDDKTNPNRIQKSQKPQTYKALEDLITGLVHILEESDIEPFAAEVLDPQRSLYFPSDPGLPERFQAHFGEIPEKQRTPSVTAARLASAEWHGYTHPLSTEEARREDWIRAIVSLKGVMGHPALKNRYSLGILSRNIWTGLHRLSGSGKSDFLRKRFEEDDQDLENLLDAPARIHHLEQQMDLNPPDQRYESDYPPLDYKELAEKELFDAYSFYLRLRNSLEQNDKSLSGDIHGLFAPVLRLLQSRMDFIHGTVSVEKISPAELARSITAGFREEQAMLPSGKIFDISVYSGEDEENPVYLDSPAVGKILAELLTNAAAHARSRIAVYVMKNEDRLLFRVRDDGPGIPPYILTADSTGRPGIFQYHVTTRENGSGLGLREASDMAVFMGGSLKADRAGDGAEFTLQFPISETPTPLQLKNPAFESWPHQKKVQAGASQTVYLTVSTAPYQTLSPTKVRARIHYRPENDSHWFSAEMPLLENFKNGFYRFGIVFPADFRGEYTFLYSLNGSSWHGVSGYRDNWIVERPQDALLNDGRSAAPAVLSAAFNSGGGARLAAGSGKSKTVFVDRAPGSRVPELLIGMPLPARFIPAQLTDLAVKTEQAARALNIAGPEFLLVSPSRFSRRRERFLYEAARKKTNIKIRFAYGQARKVIEARAGAGNTDAVLLDAWSGGNRENFFQSSSVFRALSEARSRSMPGLERKIREDLSRIKNPSARLDYLSRRLSGIGPATLAMLETQGVGVSDALLGSSVIASPATPVFRPKIIGIRFGMLSRNPDPEAQGRVISLQQRSVDEQLHAAGAVKKMWIVSPSEKNDYEKALNEGWISRSDDYLLTDSETPSVEEIYPAVKAKLAKNGLAVSPADFLAVTDTARPVERVSAESSPVMEIESSAKTGPGLFYIKAAEIALRGGEIGGIEGLRRSGLKIFFRPLHKLDLETMLRLSVELLQVNSSA